jgi:hypothetical protein
MQELEEKREELEIETNYWRDLWTAKELIEEKYKDKVEGIEKSITDTIYKETEQRKKYLKELEAQAIATANALKQAWMSWTSSVASASNGNTNNSSVNNFSFWDTIINNEADMDAFTDVIVDKVTQANKWIY